MPDPGYVEVPEPTDHDDNPEKLADALVKYLVKEGHPATTKMRQAMLVAAQGYLANPLPRSGLLRILLPLPLD